MSSETRDPREKSARFWLNNSMGENAAEMLRDLDARDPMRQLWPGIVEALAGVIAEADRETAAFKQARYILTRARALTPAREARDDTE